MPLGAKIFDIAFTVFVYLVAAAILIGAILFAFNTSQDKALFGYRYYNVITPSMSPTYNQGDMIFVKLCDASEIQVGDVITYNPSNNTDSETYLTHRVIGIPKLGSIVAFIKLRWYFIIPIIIMIAVFFLLLKRYFLLGKAEEDEKKADNDKDKSDPDTKPEETASDSAAPEEAPEKKVTLEKSAPDAEEKEDTSTQGEDTEASANGADTAEPDPEAGSKKSEQTPEAAADGA